MTARNVVVDRQARRFMAVYEAFKADNLSDLEIDVPALYLIAASSAPEPARDEVIRRAESGEAVTRQKRQFDEYGNRYLRAVVCAQCYLKLDAALAREGVLRGIHRKPPGRATALRAK
jgi:hypothetical protein